MITIPIDICLFKNTLKKAYMYIYLLTHTARLMKIHSFILTPDIQVTPLFLVAHLGILAIATH